jgi:cysteine desulfurase
LKHLAGQGFAIRWLPVSHRGVVQWVNDDAGADPAFVAIMLANHETGAIQPVRDIAMSLPPGVPIHCDAAQAVGKIPVHFHDLGVTSLSASAHKFGGPKGIGVLLLKRGTVLRPRMFGGHQQQGRRPGTEAVPLAVGLAVALDHTLRHREAHHARLLALRERLAQQLDAIASPIVLNGPELGAADVVPSTLNVSFPGCRADLLLLALDLAGVACSTGSACSSGSLLPSPVLRAMSVPEDVLRSAIRFSFGPELELTDIDEAANRIGSVVKRMRG